MKRIVAGLVSLIFVFGPLFCVHAENGFSVEDYGKTQSIRSLSISPDGKHLAFIKSASGKESDLFIVSSIETGKVVSAVSAKSKYDQKARSIRFVTNDHVMLHFSKAIYNAFFLRDGYENQNVQFYNIKKQKMSELLYTRPALVGVSADNKYALMSGSSDLLKVNLDKGSSKKAEGGTKHVIDWFVDKHGKAIAREEYDEFRDEYRVLSKLTGSWEKIFSENSNEPSIYVQALSEDEKSLVVSREVDGYVRLFALSLTDGKLSGPLFTNEGYDVDTIYRSMSRVIEGVSFSGLMPDYKFLDKQYQAHILGVEEYFAGSAIYPVSKTADASKIIFLVSGQKGADQYVLYDTVNKSISPIADSYPNIKAESIAKVSAIKYKAQDGLAINAILTWPVATESKKNLPMIVLPHGGPQSYDRIQFDWMAQFFARKGYLVFQPNFRGSSGFGTEFRDIGNGEWGKKMQTDITDGINMLIKNEYADAGKICIIGASYGGYAALAGGAFDPELFKCVASINGISDLPHLFREEGLHVNNNQYTRYWNEVIGTTSSDQVLLSEISPIKFVQDFKAPLLLIHAKDDTVVSIRQSERMYRAMKSADKNVQIIKLKDEDHWLSNSVTRIQTLQAISEFLDAYNPVN